MQNVLIIVQILMMVICCGTLIIVISQNEEKLTKLIICICIFGLVENAGYLFELLSDNADEAMMAVRGEYMGSAFIAIFILMFTLTYCGYNISLKIQRFLFLFGFIVHMNIIFCDYSHLYYKSYRFVQGKYINYLEVEKGPLYAANVIFVISLLLTSIAVSYIAVKKTADKDKRTNYKYVLASVIIPLVMFVIGLTGVFQGIDLVPPGVAIGIMIFGIAISKRHLVNVTVMAYQDVVSKINMAIVVVDYDMGFIQANDAALNVFVKLKGYKKGDKLPQNYLNDFINIRNNGGTKEIDFEEKCFNVTINTLSEGTGRIEGYVISAYDLTEERQKVEQMRKLKEAADEMSHAKSDFLARMSHEIRTPINSISGVLEMILRDSNEPNIRSYAAGAKSATKSLMGIIKDVLDTSKIEAGKMEIENAEYSFGELLYSMIRMSQMRTLAKNLDFVCNVDRTMPAYYIGDTIRFRQVIVNILGNAFKYTKTGEVILNVRGKRDGDYEDITIEVIDTGIGIKEEDMPKLFEAFERIDMDNNRNIEGTGLGMSISLKILELMNSKLEVESTYGKGSKFWFTLRQKIASEEELGDFERKYELSQQNKAMNGMYIAPDAKILVVDDNDINRSVFKGLLKNTQIDIEDVNSGKDCLDIIQKQHFDIIFMDHMMPEMDGIETLKRMKAMEEQKCSDTPVIMLTANAIRGADKEYLAAGFDDYMTKPIDTTELLGLIRRLLPEHMVKDIPFEQKMEQQERSMGAMRKPPGAPEGMGASVQMKMPEITLPDIDDINWKVALLNIPDENIVRMTAADFCKSIDKEMAKISEYYEAVSQEEYLDKYRIEVHALKSTAAMIGAMQLSGLAKLLEFAAKEKNIERIDALHPVLMEELPKYKTRLSVLSDEEETEKVTLNNAEELKELLEQMKVAMEERDFGKSDIISEKLASYDYDEDIKELMEELEEQAMNMQAYAAIETVEKIIEKLELVNKV